eukprot:1810265-Pleurochrysis_carterae.AAC.1
MITAHDGEGACAVWVRAVAGVHRVVLSGYFCSGGEVEKKGLLPRPRTQKTRGLNRRSTRFGCSSIKTRATT